MPQTHHYWGSLVSKEYIQGSRLLSGAIPKILGTHHAFTTVYGEAGGHHEKEASSKKLSGEQFVPSCPTGSPYSTNFQKPTPENEERIRLQRTDALLG